MQNACISFSRFLLFYAIFASASLFYACQKPEKHRKSVAPVKEKIATKQSNNIKKETTNAIDNENKKEVIAQNTLQNTQTYIENTQNNTAKNPVLTAQNPLIEEEKQENNQTPVFSNIEIQFNNSNTERKDSILTAPDKVIQTQDTAQIAYNNTFNNVIQSEEELKKQIFVQFETRLLFESGNKHLNDKNQRRLKDLIRSIYEDVVEYRTLHPNEPLILLLQVRGFADEKPFYENQKLEERKTLNQQLSLQRAQTVAHYIKNNIGLSDVSWEEVVEGWGEELPIGISDEGEPDINPQRRICSVYVLIVSEH